MTYAEILETEEGETVIAIDDHPEDVRRVQYTSDQDHGLQDDIEEEEDADA